MKVAAYMHTAAPIGGSGVPAAGVFGKQRIELGPAGFHDFEMPVLPGKLLEGPGGGRTLGAIQVEQATDVENVRAAARVFPH